ncbi:MAG: hypothetical protein ACFFB2_04625 [Promethearchaeota archaeon]
MAVGASNISELRIVKKFNAPDLSTARKIQKRRFPDYQTFKRAQDLGVQKYSDLRIIDRFKAPDLETAKKIIDSGFSTLETYQKAQTIGASTFSELKLIEKLQAPDLATTREIQSGNFPDYQTYRQARSLGARTYSELQLMTKRPTISADVEVQSAQEKISSKRVIEEISAEVGTQTLITKKLQDERLFPIDEEAIEVSSKIEEPQKEVQVSVPDIRDESLIRKRDAPAEEIPSTERKISKKEVPVKQVIEIIDVFFASDLLVTSETQDKWDMHKKEYYRQRTLFLDFGELSESSFRSYLQKLRMFFTQEMGIQHDKLFKLDVEDTE